MAYPIYRFMRIVQFVLVLFAALGHSAVSTEVVHAHGDDDIRIRVTQVAYRSADADIYIDGKLTFAGIGDSMTTDYVTLPVGVHTVAVVSSGDNPVNGIALEQDFPGGHDYHLIGHGDTGNLPAAFVAVDETGLLEDGNMRIEGGTRIVVNVFDTAFPLDIYIDDILTVTNLEPFSAAAFPLPSETYTVRLTPAGEADITLLEETNNPMPYTLTTTIGWGDPESGDYAIVNDYYSDLSIGNWLRAMSEVPDSGFVMAAQAISSGSPSLFDELTSPRQFTLFLPTDSVVREFDPSSVPGDTTVEEVVQYNIAQGRYTPYEIVKQTQVTTLQGGDLTFNFVATESGYWEINGSVAILTSIRLSNGVIYVTDGVLIPETDDRDH